MPATHKIDNNAKLIITTWEGVAIDVDLINAIKNYQKNIQGNPDYQTYNEVVNFSKVSSIRLTTAGIKGIARIASNTDRGGVNKKLAIILD